MHGLRAECEAQRIGYVLAIGCDRRVPTPAGPVRADALVAGLPRWAWQQLSAGPGAKGERFSNWAWITLTLDDHADSGCWWLLVRRHRHTGELAFYRCYSPQTVPLRELVRVAGRRWAIEESFQAGKGLAGLDEHQVRRWTSWRCWTLLAMIAHALLVVIAAHEHSDRPAPAWSTRAGASRRGRRVPTARRTRPRGRGRAGPVRRRTAGWRG